MLDVVAVLDPPLRLQFLRKELVKLMKSIFSVVLSVKFFQYWIVFSSEHHQEAA